MKSLRKTENDYLQHWSIIKSAIITICAKNASGLSFEELYRNAYLLVLHKHGEYLYENTKNILTEHLKSLKINDLTSLLKNYKEYSTSLSMIRDILMYLDRVYIKSHKLPSIVELGTNLFSSIAFEPVKEKCFNECLLLIKEERNGNYVEIILLKTFIKILSSIDKYDEFEIKFLEESSIYYQLECKNISNSVTSFINRLTKRFNEEEQRVILYFYPSTWEKLSKLMENICISSYVNEIIAVFFTENNSYQKTIYSLLHRIKPEGLSKLCSFIQNHIVSEGMSINEEFYSNKNSILYISNVFDFMAKYDKIYAESLDCDKTFQISFHRCFEQILNNNQRFPECISLYIEDFLRSSSKISGLSQLELNKTVSRLVSLIGYVHDKDTFERYYCIHLAKRLLKKTTISDEFETFFISKLKLECGNQYTVKMEGMFSDINISKEIMKEFNASCRSEVLNVNILTATFWPLASPQPDIEFPKELEILKQEFSEFYCKRHNGRKLHWNTHGSVDVKAYLAKKHELVLSLYQAFILLLFNEHDSLTIELIYRLTNIPKNEIQRVLTSFSSPKCKLMIKSGNETYSLNKSFSSTHYRVKVPLPKIKSGENEGEGEMICDQQYYNETKLKIDESRKHMIDAVIVRIMKSRKTLHHSVLLDEVFQQVQSRFKPQISDIKKRIDVLIEKEYLERLHNDQNIYGYLA